MAWQPSRGGFWVDEAGGRGRVDEAGGGGVIGGRAVKLANMP